MANSIARGSLCLAIAIIGLVGIAGSHARPTPSARPSPPSATPPKPAGLALTPEEQAWLDKDHVVRVRVGMWPPFIVIDEKIHGIAIDYLETIFRWHSIRYEYITDKEVSWKEGLEHIRNRRVIDLVPTAKITAERQSYMAFTNEYLFLPWVIFTRTDAPFVGGVDDLKDKTVCVPEGYVMHALLKSQYPQIKLKVIRGPGSAAKCMQALALGQADAYIGNLTVGSYVIQSRGLTNIKVAAPTPFGNHNQAMAMRKDWPELASIINKSLKSFAPEQRTSFRNKWLAVRYEHGLRPADLLIWVIGVIGVAAAIVLVIALWNRRLRREIEERKKAEAELRGAHSEIKALRGILPLCSFCKKVRDDNGDWQQVDVYIRNYSAADVSHGVCPDCVREHYPEIHPSGKPKSD
jgi:ABC-type amino acid transport substrate-binding protein